MTALSATERNSADLAATPMDQLLCNLMFVQLRAFGVLPPRKIPSATGALEGWRAPASMPAFYGRWLAESVRILHERGYLGRDGTLAVVLDPVSVWSEWDASRQKWLVDKDLHIQVQLLDLTLRALPDILGGARRATEILFPRSSVEQVGAIYEKSPVSAHFNQVLADTLLAYVEQRCSRNPGVRLRLIEIGAGTGGTSGTLFERLAPLEHNIGQYCYTDISKAFLLHGQEKFGAIAPYLSCERFNVEQPLAGQTITLGSYDVAIATNVLHATRNIRESLRNVKATLKRGGMLLINEIVGHSLFTHLTFGLLEGWWLYEDAALRIRGTPAIAPETWRRVLASEGFGSIRFPAEAAHRWGQQLIISESDGVVRQRRQS